MKRKIKTLLLAMVCIMMLTACNQVKSDSKAGDNKHSKENTWLIGAMGTTKSENSNGEEIKNGIEMAIEDINSEGGINGYEVSYLFQDDEDQSEKANNIYNTLKDWGMQILIGPTNNEFTNNIYKTANEDNLVVISPNKENSSLAKKYKNVYEIELSDPEKGKGIAEYLDMNAEGKSIGVLTSTSTNDYYLINNSFEKNSAELGLNIAVKKNYKPNDKTDYVSILNEYKNAGVEIIILEVEEEEVSKIYNTLIECEYQATIIGIENMSIFAENESVREENDVFEITEFNNKASLNKYLDFCNRYQEKYGKEPTKKVAQSYDAVYAIKNVIEQMNLTPDMDQEEILEGIIGGMNTVNINGLTGDEIHWDEEGIIEKKLQIYQIQN